MNEATDELLAKIEVDEERLPVMSPATEELEVLGVLKALIDDAEELPEEPCAGRDVDGEMDVRVDRELGIGIGKMLTGPEAEEAVSGPTIVPL